MSDLDRRRELDRFYELLDELEAATGGRRLLADCHGRMGWPDRGVYFFFEKGEVRADRATQRVVRVGTHALRPSKSTLWKRLAQHRGTLGGTFPGGGNHRGSIFRLHVGTALLARNSCWSDDTRRTWSVGSTADRATRETEHPLEQAVSDYIGQMPFLWLEVDDPPGPHSDRGVIEAGAISLLSNMKRVPIDAPSSEWLGHAADREAIRTSGLWNVNHVGDRYSSEFLATMERWVDRATPVAG